MTGAQIIRTPAGEELVVLPRAEYEALLERARKASWPPGGVVLPEDVSAAILRGDSSLKAIRAWRGATQHRLNYKIGLGQGYLSDLENGRRAGTQETLAKLAQALDVPVEWLS